MTNIFGALDQLQIGPEKFSFYSLPKLAKALGQDFARLPYSHKVLLENLLRHQDEQTVFKKDIEAFLNFNPKLNSDYEIQYTPSRVLLQDFTGVPVVADLAAMRAGMAARGGDTAKVNPLRPVDLVIDHSVQVDVYGREDALALNAKYDFERNGERYQFLKWGQKAFRNFQVVPPATGICHQVNLEFLASVAMVRNIDGRDFIYPDTVVGTDSHTPMVNALGVVGWGVGGIEAEAAMLGQPVSMLIPEVVGFELKGQLPAGATATDLVLTVTQMLRKKGVVGKFVEFFGDGVKNLAIADRATLGNMAPEYGATIGIFAVDSKTIEYLKLTGREKQAARTEAYFKAQEMWFDETKPAPVFNDTLSLDLASVETSIAGPSRPHDRVILKEAPVSFQKFLTTRYEGEMTDILAVSAKIERKNLADYQLKNGAIVIAAITSCTNTSNPALMLGAALLARNAAENGLARKPWVKTSFAPGSKVVTDYIHAAGLTNSLNQLGFDLVGYGCTTCIGNSGPLDAEIAQAITDHELATVSVLSGNRNFEARIHPQVMGNYLMSPPLVVAYAIAGNINIDLTKEPLGTDPHGKEIFLKDIWPAPAEVEELVKKHVTVQKFKTAYADVFSGDANWREIAIPAADTYEWNEKSSYIQHPPFLAPELIEGGRIARIESARILGLFGDFITTDHISPAGSIGASTPAGKYLLGLGVQPVDFNSYGARRGNHEVMIRGTFANVRLKNKMVSREGGFTKVFPEGSETTIFEASQAYAKAKTPLVIFAGKEYGSGSSRDWAAKGTRLLGVRAVVAQSFERIHRSNLVGMGVLPLQFFDGDSVESLGLRGDEVISIDGIDAMKPKSVLKIRIDGGSNGEVREISALVRIDTPNELRYFRAGGILPYVLDRIIKNYSGFVKV